MDWNKDLTELSHLMAGLYPVREETYRIVEQAELSTVGITFHNKAIDNWHEILKVAVRSGRVLDLINIVLIDYPHNPALNQIEQKLLAR